ncbi:MAG TPA: hypothetical protein ENH41_03455 [Candidatus Omnitrophica bacterium]|nr:hypothetical protein [Candidatus Omnitrophota bacterium]
MKTRVFTFHSDPGHAWLEVTKQDLRGLFIVDDISGYSYMSGEKVYLEEDCDALKFLKSYQLQYGKMKIDEKHMDGESFIRNLQSYKA